jgi:hypothetical protein
MHSKQFVSLQLYHVKNKLHFNDIQVTIDIGPIGPLAVKGGNKSAQSARWQLKNTSIGQIGLWQLKVTSIGVLYAKTQFAIDTVNIYFNKEVTKLYLKFMILKFK